MFSNAPIAPLLGTALTWEELVDTLTVACGDDFDFSVSRQTFRGRLGDVRIGSDDYRIEVAPSLTGEIKCFHVRDGDLASGLNAALDWIVSQRLKAHESVSVG